MTSPDDERQEVLLHRMASLMALFSFFVIFVGAYIFTEIMDWPTINEFGITVPTGSLVTTTPVPSNAPPIQISADETVVFSTLRLPRDDHDLNALCSRLRQIAPLTSSDNSLPIEPDPRSRHERLIEVLSAIQRAGIRHYHLR